MKHLILLLSLLVALPAQAAGPIIWGPSGTAKSLQSSDLDLDNQKGVRLGEQSGNGSNYIKLVGPDAVTSNTTLKLPDGDGADTQVLGTDGAGQLEWLDTTLTNNETSAANASFAIDDNDNVRTVLMTSGASNRTVTLPDVANNLNRILTLKKVDSGVGTAILARAGSATIDGATSVTLYKQYESITVQSDGTDWVIISVNWASGSYTPTWTAINNCTAGTPSIATYTRQGTVGTASGQVNCTSIAVGEFIIDISVPFTLDTATFECSGTAVFEKDTPDAKGCKVIDGADATKCRIICERDTGSGFFGGSFIFQYRIAG